MEEKLIFALQNDLKTLSLETKKKHGGVKEACEEAISKIRGAQSSSNCLPYITNQALYPVIQGCETKEPKILKLCLHSIQRLITGGYVDVKGAKSICDSLIILIEQGLEEIKILQTIALLLTTNNVVTGELLAQNLVLCFRLNFSKNTTTVHAAGATVRQIVSLVFERIDKDKQASGRDLTVETNDAYMLLQDLILLVNGEQPNWLNGITEMTRSFGLELLESILARFPYVFEKNAAFALVLKEKVCAMVIKLFSPNAKFKLSPEISLDKPFYPISVRLLRIVDILINKYYGLLVTECEIFLSLLVRFLDPDKPTWQRCLALEILHKLIASPSHLAKFCRSYDLKPHATNICKDMINALGAYVQSVFANPASAMSSGLLNTPAPIGSTRDNVNPHTGTSSGPSPSPTDPSALMGFYFRGSFVPLINTYSPLTPKSQLMDLTEKQEPPQFATCESYGVAISFACLSDFVLSLLSINKSGDEKIEERAEVVKQLLLTSWPGLLAALNLLLEASIDDNITELICERLVGMATLSGEVGLQQCREATVLSLCVATLPPHYGYAVLKGTVGHGESPIPLSYSETDNIKQQVVVVGTSVVPSLHLPPSLQSSPVMLTKKNLLVTRAVIHLSLTSGSLLLTSWLTLLTTLQHLCWVCNIVPKSSSEFILTQTPPPPSSLPPLLNSNNNSGGLGARGEGLSELGVGKGKGGMNGGGGGGGSVGVMGAVLEFGTILGQGVGRLVEVSVQLDDVSLHHIINALTNMSQEAMEIAYLNREPSLFAVAKLLEIGLSNLDRVEIYWRPLTSHLLEVCRHPHIRMREWGSEAITYLVRSALLHQDTDDEKVNQLLISPLCELSSILHNDVRSKQLAALGHILHCKGEKLRSSWPLAINILGAIYDHHSEGLIRSAFQCLHLVITDFLPVLPWSSLPHLIDTVAKFARQKQELNVALSAIGSMWNIADFFYQNRDKMGDNPLPDISLLPNAAGIPAFDRLWLGIYLRLSGVCTDERPAVRKSSGQTLFSTIGAHSNILDKNTWDAVMWQVLFPLLESVEGTWKSASCEKVDTQNALLIHHSRNTEQKQWAETQVLVLSGIAKIFSIKRASLLEIEDFPKTWFFFLQFIQNSATSLNEEVCLSALKSFHEALQTPAESSVPMSPESGIWTRSWKVYIDIGEEVICTRGAHQQFLTAYVTLFQTLFPPMKFKLSSDEVSRVGVIFSKCLVIPLTAEGASSIMFSTTDSGMSPLQDQLYSAYNSLVTETRDIPELKKLLPPIILQLVDSGAYAVRSVTSTKAIPLEGVVPNCMEFGIKCLALSVTILGLVASETSLNLSQLFYKNLEKFNPILASRFENSEGAWRDSVESYFGAVPLMVEQKPSEARFWVQLAKNSSDFLFFSGPGEWNVKKGWKDEKYDIRMVTLLKSLLFRSDLPLPTQFLVEVVKMFHRGSCINDYDGINVSEREEFVRFCFSSLLEFVLKGPTNVCEIIESQTDGDGKRVAVLALLQRFQNILISFRDHVTHNSHIPIQRHRLAEMNFVLRSIASLINNLKTADPVRASGTWDCIVGLYPDLVGIVGLNGVDSLISGALADALISYKDLLQKPICSRRK